MERLTAQAKILISDHDLVVEQAMESLSNASVRTAGPELIFGKLYDHIGFGQINEELFRHLVVARPAFSLSKLETPEYLYCYLGIELKVNIIYRFMDKLNDRLKAEVEQKKMSITGREDSEGLKSKSKAVSLPNLMSTTGAIISTLSWNVKSGSLLIMANLMLTKPGMG